MEALKEEYLVAAFGLIVYLCTAMHWYKKFLTKPITITVALLAALPITPILFCFYMD